MFFKRARNPRSRARHYVRPFTGPADRPESPGGIRARRLLPSFSIRSAASWAPAYHLLRLRPDRVLSPASDPGHAFAVLAPGQIMLGTGLGLLPLPGGTTSPHLPSSGPRRHRSRTDIPGCRRPPGRRPLQPAGTNRLPWRVLRHAIGRTPSRRPGCTEHGGSLLRRRLIPADSLLPVLFYTLSGLIQISQVALGGRVLRSRRLSVQPGRLRGIPLHAFARS